LSRQLDKLNNQLKTIAAWRPFFYNPNPRPMPRKPPESPELSLANFWSQGSCEGKCYGAVLNCNTKGLFALNTLTTLTGGNVGTFEGEVGKKKIQIPV
jgi:hypothetical protein